MENYGWSIELNPGYKKYKGACCSDRRNHAYKGRRWFHDICDAHEEVRIYIKIKA